MPESYNAWCPWRWSDNSLQPLVDQHLQSPHELVMHRAQAVQMCDGEVAHRVGLEAFDLEFRSVVQVEAASVWEVSDLALEDEQVIIRDAPPILQEL